MESAGSLLVRGKAPCAKKNENALGRIRTRDNPTAS